MSFILDALKKSETERQQQSTAEFSSVPTSSADANPARWLWLLAALLLINFAVLIGILLRPTANPPGQPDTAVNDSVATVAPAPPSAPATATSFSEQVATAVREQPAAGSGDATAAEPARAVPESPPVRATTTAPVATLDELRLNGTIALPELHLDIHVFSDDPAARFVFINMDKHREGSRIAAGPVVKEITPDGVILEYQGKDFLLPRE
jgi:general secretion pathway protein B